MTDNAKYGDLVEAVTAAVKRSSEGSRVEKPKEEILDTDVICIVEEGQSAHGLMLKPEGPQPGTTSNDYMGENLDALSVDALSFEYDHWQNAFQNTKAYKKDYEKAFSGWPTGIYIDAASRGPSQEKAQEALRSVCIEVKLTDLIPSDDGPAMGSPGVFYYVDFEKLSVPFYFPGPADTAPKPRVPKMLEAPHGESLMTATHGTSMGAAKKIIADWCMTEALNKTEGKRGAYCEGAHRKHCTASYSTMNVAADDSADLNLYGVFSSWR